ncbi:MAG: arginine repressor [Ilumatobacteraceae bacterium]
MTSKVQRQQTIARIISENSVTSQHMLLDLLGKEGIEATQATVSRDLEDLGAVKVRVRKGQTAYAIPDFAPDRIAPQDQLRRVLSEWVAEVDFNEPMVVVRTPPGCAHVVASALDRSRIKGIIGTVAGDDTLLWVVDAKYGAKRLASDIRGLAGLSKVSR